jgi:outer membrane protein OmpA-like peptidoglycan-associated protein
VTPDGRATNKGVIGGIEGGKGQVETQHNASQFALIVTAEPHFAVTAPSTMVVMYNVADDVHGSESKVTTLIEHADYSRIKPLLIDEDTTPELVQARYAVAIAEDAGAERYAPDALETAQQKLAEAEAAQAGKRKERDAAAELAREAVVTSASLRAAAVEGERRAAAEAQRRTSETEAARTSREELRNRLDAALPTHETDRGLVSEIGGLQFSTGAAELSTAARESLARLAGIVASYPGLRFSVEGHTDDTGSVATNNELSLRRAIAVRDYLIGQGIPASAIDVEGYGPSKPVSDNLTADGRARNRRVEIIIAGELLTAR